MQIPQLLGDYEVGEKIGAGSMGTVYRARRLALQKDVAVKILHPQWAEDPEVAARFETEATSAASIDHVNIVRVLDYGQQDGFFFIAMEFIEGINLKELLRLLGPPRPEIGALILRDLCRGLESAHESGVIHRDIKPENLAVTIRGEVKIMDFGLARRAGHDSAVTVQGTVLGTAAYMSPEQALGKHVDRRSDIFSLGLVAYELFSGQRAFPGDTYGQVIHRVLTEEPVPLSKLVPSLAPEILSVVEDMTRKDLESRCQDVSLARDRLEAIVRDLHLPREDKLLRELVESARPAAADETVVRPGAARRQGPEGPAGSSLAARSSAPVASHSLAERAETEGQIDGREITPSAARLPVGEAAPRLERIEVNAGTSSMRAGGTTRCIALGIRGDGSSIDLTEQASWSTNDQEVARVDSAGVLSALGAGEVEVEAKYEGLGGLAVVRVEQRKRPLRLLPVAGILFLIVAAAVGGKLILDRANRPAVRISPTAPKLLRIDVEPAEAAVNKGNETSFRVVGTFAGDSTAPVAGGVVWRTGDTSIAVIDATGAARAVGEGETAVTAAVGSMTGTAQLLVVGRVMTGIRITPASGRIRPGESVAFKAWGSYSDTPGAKEITDLAHWDIRGPAIASVEAKGIVRGKSAGTCWVTVSLDGRTTEAKLTVESQSQGGSGEIHTEREFLIVMRPAGRFRYVLIDDDPTPHMVEEGNFSHKLATGDHRFTIVPNAGDNITLRYRVRPGDSFDQLILYWESGRVEPGRR